MASTTTGSTQRGLTARRLTAGASGDPDDRGAHAHPEGGEGHGEGAGHGEAGPLDQDVEHYGCSSPTIADSWSNQESSAKSS